MGSCFGPRGAKKGAFDWPLWNYDFLSRIRIRNYLLAGFDFQDAGRCFEWECGRYEDYG